MTMPQHPFDDRRLADLPVDDGLAALLAELDGEVPVDEVEERRTRRRWPMILGAAASVLAVAAVPAYVAQRGPGETPTTQAAPSPSPASTASATPAAPPTKQPVPPPALVEETTWVGPSSYALLDAAGWTIEPDSVNTQAGYGVEVTYVSAGQRFTLQWIRTRWFDSLVRSAEREGPTSSLEVLGEEATYVTYDSAQQMAYVPVQDGYGLRVDGAFTTPAVFEALVADLRIADEADFSAVLPAGTVLPARAADVTQEMLAATQASPGTVVDAAVGFNARYHVAAAVVTDVGCAWVDQWLVGDAAARSEAQDALAGSREWAPLVDDLRQPRWFAARSRRCAATGRTSRSSARRDARPRAWPPSSSETPTVCPSSPSADPRPGPGGTGGTGRGSRSGPRGQTTAALSGSNRLEPLAITSW